MIGRKFRHGFLINLFIFAVLVPAWADGSSFVVEGSAFEKDLGFKTGGKKKGKRHHKKKKSSKKVDMSAVPADKKTEKAYLKLLGEGFQLKRTRHYSVFYNTSEDDLKSFSIAIEMTYRSCLRYAMKLGITIKPPKRKLPIFYFNKHEEYSHFAEKQGKGSLAQNMTGVYFPDDNFSMFYNVRNMGVFAEHNRQVELEIEKLRDMLMNPHTPRRQKKLIRRQIAALRTNTEVNRNRGGGITESTVQHEVSHQVLWNIGFHNPGGVFTNPRWFVEGTAQLFETVSNGKAANWGALNRERLTNFRAVAKAHQLIPVRSFITSFVPFFREDAGALAYPESWALVHYLNRARRKDLKKYINLIKHRPKDFKSTPEREIADFEKAFGKLDEKWVKKWLRWIRQIK